MVTCTPFALGVVHAVIEVHHLLGGIGNAFNVGHGLGGQAHHKVELDRCVPCLKGNPAGLFNFIPGDVFIDDVTQALGTGLGCKGQAALADAGGLFNQALGEVIHPQRRQRQADVLLGGPAVQIIQQLFQLAVVRGGQAGQAQFLIAGVGTQILGGLVQQSGIPLAHGPVEEAGLAEPAATDAAPQHFDAGTVLDGAHHGHHKVGGRGKIIHVPDDRLGHHSRNAGLVGGDGLDAAILVVGHIIESRNIHAGILAIRRSSSFLEMPSFFPCSMAAQIAGS